MTIKEKLLLVLEELAHAYKATGYTIIICLETTEQIPMPLGGFRNKSGYGTLFITAMGKDAAFAIIKELWNRPNKCNDDGSGSNSQ